MDKQIKKDIEMRGKNWEEKKTRSDRIETAGNVSLPVDTFFGNDLRMIIMTWIDANLVSWGIWVATDL